MHGLRLSHCADDTAQWGVTCNDCGYDHVVLVIISARRGGDRNRLSLCLQHGESQQGWASGSGDGDGIQCSDVQRVKKRWLSWLSRPKLAVSQLSGSQLKWAAQPPVAWLG